MCLGYHYDQQCKSYLPLPTGSQHNIMMMRVRVWGCWKYGCGMIDVEVSPDGPGVGEEVHGMMKVRLREPMKVLELHSRLCFIVCVW